MKRANEGQSPGLVLRALAATYLLCSPENITTTASLSFSAVKVGDEVVTSGIIQGLLISRAPNSVRDLSHRGLESSTPSSAPAKAHKRLGSVLPSVCLLTCVVLPGGVLVNT